MKLNEMKNIIIIKNLPSNLIEEAIIVVKDKNGIKNFVNKEDIENDDIIEESINKEEYNRIKNIQKENRKYIVKEAEMVVSDYLDKIDENKKYVDRLKTAKTYKKMRYANICLACTSIISTMICVLK